MNRELLGEERARALINESLKDWAKWHDRLSRTIVRLAIAHYRMYSKPRDRK